VVVLLIVAGVLVWGGSTLIIDAVVCRNRRGTLTERLLPFRPVSVADEVEEWLKGR
jgi:hypothetical protein